jgi:RNA polymerase sigma-70 factor (ECF subfamily)
VTNDLVTLAQGGDRRALDRLFERYLPRVKIIVRARMGSTAGSIEDYDDLAQEAIIKAFKKLDRYEVRTESRFYNWMATIVEREVIDARRRAEAKRRKPGSGRVLRIDENPSDSLSALLIPGKTPSPSTILGARDLEDRIARALGELEEHYREAIILRQVCDMPYDEICEVLGYGNPGTVRKILSRALELLEEKVGLSGDPASATPEPHGGSGQASGD